jgi:translation initiation factor IF-3
VPICRIVEYGKFKYELSKKKKETAKKQRESTIKTKEIKFRPSTDENDLKTKADKVEKFLNEGDRVKITIMFRGREITHKEVGIETLNKFIDMIPNIELINEPSMQGRILSTLVGRKKEAKNHDSDG